MTQPLVLAAGSVLDADAFEVARVAGAAGFAGIGLRLSADHIVERSRRAELRRMLDDCGLVLHDVEVHRIGDSRDGDLEQLDRLLEAAAALGARSVLVVSDLCDLVATEDRLGVVAERCRTAGLVAALEYMAWTTPSDPSTAVRMAEATGSEVVVDVLHHARIGAGAAHLEQVVASGRLGWVQLADAPSTAPSDLVHEARHARLPPGEGDLPLSELLSVVPAGTVVSVEVQSDQLASELAPAERAVRLHDAARVALRERRSQSSRRAERQPPRMTGYRPK